MSIENIILSPATEIETDGTIVTHTRDPPGQRSVYIAPGDTFREIYRLATFKDFPQDAQADPRQLATYGFFYTGYRDRVKCFSCGQRIENWQFSDDPASAQWHTNVCDFFFGRDTANVPIHAVFSRLGFAQPSSSRQSHSRNGTGTSRAANETLSSAPTTQTSMQETLPQSMRQSYHTRTAQQRPTGPLRNGFEQSSAYNENFEMFTCLHPINPHMRSEEARLQTFLDYASIWPAHRVRAPPREIVKAGMYYLGERDRVKCWYCNGGLQNWEYDDDPFTEHAKWFPQCEFVLRTKGVGYVHNIVAQFPNLRRPTLTNPSNAVQFSFPTAESNVRPSSVPPHSQSSSNPVIVDPRQDQEQRNRRIEEEMNASEFVAQARLMGFEERNIRKAVKRQYEQFDVGFLSFERLVDVLVDSIDESEQESSSASGHTSSGQSGAATASSNHPAERGEAEQLRELQDQRTCKKCHRDEANVVLIPCGHLSICIGCSERATRCPACHSYIREKVRSYLS